MTDNSGDPVSSGRVPTLRRPDRRSSAGRQARGAIRPLRGPERALLRYLWLALDHVLKEAVTKGRLEIVDVDGVRREYAGTEGPHVTVRLHDPRIVRRMLLGPSIAVGEAYTNGTLSLEEGSLYDLVELYAKNLGASDPLPLRRLRRALERAAERAPLGPGRRSRWIGAHAFEESERFFRLFQDDSIDDSSGYFTDPRDDLSDAQTNERRHIAAKLRLSPGLEVLDVGSGWGSLALDLATHFEVHVLGITRSRRQLEISRRRAREAGLSRRVRFECCDLSAVRGKFDRIVSTGTFERLAVRRRYRAHFERISDLLTDDGIALLHAAGRMDPPRVHDPWIERHLFPRAHVPSLSEVFAALERAKLWCTDLEILRLHHAATLRLWRERLLARREDAARLYGEPFCRMWELYLVAAEVAFRELRQMAFQMQLTRGIDAVPTTRDYMFEVERSLEIDPRGQAAAPALRLLESPISR